ncbi:MAG: hypothetical protein A2511_12495 [Deltaproteobacteria bacterium RIFOXYD12_FULL_50_9]|nr:MAG: hypothetical protein A2511_12495 [Deltaproteobacteria bacterium RIFOXYD12_FULL_50_9]
MSSAKTNLPPANSLRAAISPTARKALVSFWGNEEIINKPEIIAELGADNVARINRIGNKSLFKIAEFLNSQGYINSLHDWLAKEK